jgi:hypothetical protein
MTTVLPIGYVTLLEAADMLQKSMHVGIPDLPIVVKLREQALDVNDGPARDRAIAELWNGVDRGTVRLVAVGGRPRRIVGLDAQFTKGVPGLRSPCGRGFTLLRQSNPAYHELASWFGASFHTATLAVRETEVRKLGRTLMRRRRATQTANGETKRRGRVPIISTVQTVIKDVVTRRKWNSTMGIKALVREVNHAWKTPQLVSRDTVIRALDGLHDQTGDRQFERVRHQRRQQSSAS